MRHNIKKTFVCITALIFILTAFIPAVHSQFFIGFSNQIQDPITSETSSKAKIDTLIQRYTIPMQPLPLDNDPPNVHLPSNPVTMKVFSSATSYFRTSLSNVPAGYEVTNTNYSGWCTDSDHYIHHNTAYQVTLYSSYNVSLPTHLYHQNWSKVNYILNNKMGCHWQQIQYAILYILDFGDQGLNSQGWSLVNNAIQNGTSYVPGGGDIIAIIADAGPTIQRTVFELIVPTYNLCLSVNGMGSINKNPNQTSYTYNQVVQLTAISDPGWSFSQWSGDLSGSTNPITITMTGDKTVTATFTACIYTLSLTTSGTGTGTIETDTTGPYYYGDIVTIWANATTGSTFTGFTGDLTGTTTPQQLTITSDKTVDAEFTLDGPFTLTITVDPADGGSVDIVPDPPYYYGTVVTLTAEENPGYNFSHWGGDLSGNENPKTITMTSNKSVIAHFTFNEEDTTPPLVQITKPIRAIYIFNKEILPFNIPIIIQAITIEVNATDNESGIDRVEFYINGELKSTEYSEPFSYDWRELRSGLHTIQVKAFDKAGNNATT
ncbi:MAG: Ig-like domain-containing protein, partial [Thermoplasmatota archaeon]